MYVHTYSPPGSGEERYVTRDESVVTPVDHNVVAYAVTVTHQTPAADVQTVSCCSTVHNQYQTLCVASHLSS